MIHFLFGFSLFLFSTVYVGLVENSQESCKNGTEKSPEASSDLPLLTFLVVFFKKGKVDMEATCVTVTFH